MKQLDIQDRLETLCEVSYQAYGTYAHAAGYLMSLASTLISRLPEGEQLFELDLIEQTIARYEAQVNK